MARRGLPPKKVAAHGAPPKFREETSKKGSAPRRGCRGTQWPSQMQHARSFAATQHFVGDHWQMWHFYNADDEALGHGCCRWTARAVMRVEVLRFSDDASTNDPRQGKQRRSRHWTQQFRFNPEPSFPSASPSASKHCPCLARRGCLGRLRPASVPSLDQLQHRRRGFFD